MEQSTQNTSTDGAGKLVTNLRRVASGVRTGHELGVFTRIVQRIKLNRSLEHKVGDTYGVFSYGSSIMRKNMERLLAKRP